MALLHQVRHAMRDHARLARPRAREDEQCAVDVFDGGSLFGVEG